MIMELEYTPEELAIKRAEVARTKTMLLNEVIELNNKMHGRGRLSNNDYQSLMRRKSELTREILRLDGQLQELKITAVKMTQRNDMAKLEAGQRPQEQPQEEPRKLIVTRLNEIREEYQVFAADATRSPTMRRMASEFVLNLNGVIREALTTKKTL